MSEIWRDAPGFEGRYQVSDLGRVRSLSRRVPWGRGWRIVQGKVLRPQGGQVHLDRVSVGVAALVLRAFGTSHLYKRGATRAAERYKALQGGI